MINKVYGKNSSMIQSQKNYLLTYTIKQIKWEKSYGPPYRCRGEKKDLI